MDYIYILKIIGTILFGIFLGAVSTIPVGAVQLQVIKKAINGHLRPAILTALGSVTSVLIYGVLALFGFGYFLVRRDFQLVVYTLGIIVLSFLVIKMYRERHDMIHQEETQVVKYRGRVSFLSGFTIAITNPGMVIWWVIGYRFFLDLNFFEQVSTGIKALFILSGCAGLGGYLIFISLFVHRVKKSFSSRFLFIANMFIVILLGIMVIYFIAKLVSLIFNLNIGLDNNLTGL